MEHPPHRLDPLQAWNTARSIAAASVDAVKEARDTSSDNPARVFDPTAFDATYQHLANEYEVWPYVSAVQLHTVVYTGEDETATHDELVSYVGEWIMDRLKESAAFTLTTDTDNGTKSEEPVNATQTQAEDTTDADPDPSSAGETVDTDPLTRLARELVSTSEHPDATYAEVDVDHDSLPSLRPAILRMEVVNRAAEDREQHITNVRTWLAELAEADTPPTRVQRQPMGVAPTTD